jgi:hypothetical protein
MFDLLGKHVDARCLITSATRDLWHGGIFRLGIRIAIGRIQCTRSVDAMMFVRNTAFAVPVLAWPVMTLPVLEFSNFGRHLSLIMTAGGMRMVPAAAKNTVKQHWQHCCRNSQNTPHESHPENTNQPSRGIVGASHSGLNASRLHLPAFVITKERPFLLASAMLRSGRSRSRPVAQRLKTGLQSLPRRVEP